MLEVDAKKNEVEAGDENRNITDREMVDQSCGMEPRTQLKIQDQQIFCRPRRRWENDINEFLNQIEDETENPTESSNHVNKNWINTAKRPRRWTLLEENYTKNSVTRSME